jgi:hypothetical protein
LIDLYIPSTSTPIWCDNLGATYLSANPIFNIFLSIFFTLFFPFFSKIIFFFFRIIFF